MTINTEKPWFLRILPDTIAFGIGLGMAYFLNWETKDLVWSLWLCSLVLGYLTLLSTIGASAYIGLHVIIHKDFKKPQRVPAILIGTAAGLFFLGFFSLHFCGFHAGHSVFLRHFFPVEGMPSDGFGRAFMNPPLLWLLVFRHLMEPYGLFLIPAIIAERQHVFLPLIRAVKTAHTEMTMDGLVVDRAGRKPGKNSNPVGDAMGRPYINVVRMHLLIFFFAFCHALKVDSFLVYAVVYAVYFFPWREVAERRLRAANRTDAGAAWPDAASSTEDTPSHEGRL
jgi:hypothetical protein